MNDIILLDDDNFAEEVYTTKKPILIEFMASWCDNCKEFEDKFKNLMKIYDKKVKFAKVDIDKSYRLSNGLKIKKLPTFIIYYEGKPISFIIGNVSLYEFKKIFEEIL